MKNIEAVMETNAQPYYVLFVGYVSENAFNTGLCLPSDILKMSFLTTK